MADTFIVFISYVAILRPFFECRGLTKEATSWLHGGIVSHSSSHGCMAYDHCPRHPDTAARARSTPTAVPRHVVRHEPWATRSRQLPHPESLLRLRGTYHRPAVSGAVCLAGLSSARAEDGACPTLGTGLSAGRGLPPEEGQAAGRSRALLQRLCEPCRTWPGDVHACRGRCHTPVRFDARRRADTPGRGRPTGRAGRHAGRLLHAATACASAALAAAYPLALRSWRLGEEES